MMSLKHTGGGFLLALLISVCEGQSVGHGISKHTWAASHPRQCYNWFYDFLPVREDFGSCTDGNCECATQVPNIVALVADSIPLCCRVE